MAETERGRAFAWALLGAVLLALAVVAPVLPAVLEGTAQAPVLFGDGVDLLGTLWTYDHVDQMLRGQTGPVRADVFAPLGFDTGLAQGMAWLDAVVAWPLVAALGTPGFYNSWVLLLIVLDVLGLVALFRTLGAPLVVALGLAGGLVLSPWFLRELFEGRPTQVFLLFHAGFLLCLARLMAGQGKAWLMGLGGGLCLLGACLTYWFTGMAVGLLGAVVWAVAAVGSRSSRRSLLVGGAVLASTALGLGLLVTTPVRQTLIDRAGELRDVAPLSLQAALLETGVPVVFVLLCLAVLVVLRRRASLPWVIGTIALSTLPLGAQVLVGDQVLTMPLAAVEQLLPVFRRLVRHSRLAIVPMLGLACALAAASGALASVGRGSNRRAALLAGVLLSVLAVRVEGLLRGPQWQARPSVALFDEADFYAALVERWPGGVIDLPVLASNQAYAYQLLHRQPVLGGPGIQGPYTRSRAHKHYVEDNSFLTALEAAIAGQPVPAWERQDLRQLQSDGFSAVVIHQRFEGRVPDAVAELVGPLVVTGRSRVAAPLPGPGRSGRRPRQDRD